MPKIASSQKLVAVLASFKLVTASPKSNTKIALQCVLYIWYSVQFLEKDQANKLKTLIDFGSGVNALTLTYVAKLGLAIKKTSVRAQKIDSSLLETFGMASAKFLPQGNQGRV